MKGWSARKEHDPESKCMATYGMIDVSGKTGIRFRRPRTPQKSAETYVVNWDRFTQKMTLSRSKYRKVS